MIEEKDASEIIDQFVDDVKFLFQKYREKYDINSKNPILMNEIYRNSLCISLAHLTATMKPLPNGDMNTEEMDKCIDSSFIIVKENIPSYFSYLKKIRSRMKKEEGNG